MLFEINQKEVEKIFKFDKEYKVKLILYEIQPITNMLVTNNNEDDYIADMKNLNVLIRYVKVLNHIKTIGSLNMYYAFNENKHTMDILSEFVKKSYEKVYALKCKNEEINIPKLYKRKEFFDKNKIVYAFYR